MKLSIGTHQKYNIFFIIIVFLFIYYPPILNLNVQHIIAISSFAYILLHYPAFEKLSLSKHMSFEIILLLMISMYSVLIAFINSVSIVSALVFFRLILEIVPISVACTLHMKKKRYTSYDVIKLLVIVGTIQGAISFLTFAFPELQRQIIERAISYGFDENKYITFLNRRYYGFSYNLVTYVPPLQSVLCILSLKMGMERSKKYYICVSLLAFSGIINGRSTIIIILIGLLLLLLEQFQSRNPHRIIKLFFFILILLAMSYLLIQWLKDNAYITYVWLNDGLQEIFGFFTRGDTQNGYFSTIVSWTEYLPKGIDFLFGIGELCIITNSHNIATDIGYINYLWLAGIILFILLHIFYFRMIAVIYKKGKKEKNKLIKFYSVYLFLLCIIFNIKMPIFLLNECSIVIIFSFVALCFL